MEMTLPLTPPTTTPDYLAQWIETANPGDRLEYHYGLLLYDRSNIRPFWKEVDALAQKAWALYEAGKVTLVQRRAGEFLYHYYMERK
jgi:hypothetical protein